MKTVHSHTKFRKRMAPSPLTTVSLLALNSLGRIALAATPAKAGIARDLNSGSSVRAWAAKAGIARDLISGSSVRAWAASASKAGVTTPDCAVPAEQMAEGGERVGAKRRMVRHCRDCDHISRVFRAGTEPGAGETLGQLRDMRVFPRYVTDGEMVGIDAPAQARLDSVAGIDQGIICLCRQQ